MLRLAAADARRLLPQWLLRDWLCLFPTESSGCESSSTSTAPPLRRMRLLRAGHWACCRLHWTVLMPGDALIRVMRWLRHQRVTLREARHRGHVASQRLRSLRSRRRL